MDTFPPPEAPETPSHWQRHKGKYLIGAAIVVGIGVIGAANAEDDEAAPAEQPPVSTYAEPLGPPEPTAPATTEAPATTQAPTTTRAPAPPPPPEESLADLVEDLWLDTDYCWSDCSNAYTAEEWVDRAEQYGRVDADSFVTGYEYLDAQPYGDIDAVCDEFWVMADDEVAGMAIATGIDPAAWVLNMYLWCDS